MRATWFHGLAVSSSRSRRSAMAIAQNSSWVIADSPVMAQVARDFVSLDGKQVQIPAGAKVYRTAGRVGR